MDAIEHAVDKLGLHDTVEVKLTGCHGFCQQGPIVIVEPEGVFYRGVVPDDAEEIAEKHLKNGEHVERLFYRDPETEKTVPLYKDIEFYRSQKRVVLRNCGKINPETIADYEDHGCGL